MRCDGRSATSRASNSNSCSALPAYDCNWRSVGLRICNAQRCAHSAWPCSARYSACGQGLRGVVGRLLSLPKLFPTRFEKNLSKTRNCFVKKKAHPKVCSSFWMFPPRLGLFHIWCFSLIYELFQITRIFVGSACFLDKIINNALCLHYI